MLPSMQSSPAQLQSLPTSELEALLTQGIDQVQADKHAMLGPPPEDLTVPGGAEALAALAGGMGGMGGPMGEMPMGAPPMGGMPAAPMGMPPMAPPTGTAMPIAPPDVAASAENPTGISPEDIMAASAALVQQGWMQQTSSEVGAEMVMALQGVATLVAPGLYDLSNPQDLSEVIRGISTGLIAVPPPPVRGQQPSAQQPPGLPGTLPGQPPIPLA